MSFHILIVDDQETVRSGIRSLLSARPRWTICGEAADGTDAIEKAEALHPDLVLMDVSMPGMDGLQATRAIKLRIPGTRVIIVSQNDPLVVRQQAKEVGASAWVAKADLARDLLPTIERIFVGSHSEPLNKTTSSTPEEPSLAWLTGGGEMGKLIRSMDWSATPLGPLESWPHGLRTTVSLCLSSNFPINIVWGPSYNQIYNDGYRVVVGERHPEGMGMAYDKCWASAWPAIGKPFERAWAGETSFLENQRMYLTRNGYLEETFFTFSLSPIRDEKGMVVGLFHPVTETTAKMLSERRTKALRELAGNTSEARSLEAAFALSAKTLASQELDLPFVLLYSLSKDGTEAHLLESVGIKQGLKASPKVIRLAENGDDVWPLAAVLASDAIVEVGQLHNRFGAFACGPYEEGSNLAVARALRVPGQDSALGIFIAGVSPRLPFNQDYRGHLEQVGTATATALANALAYEREKQRAEALAEIDRAKTAFFSNVSHEFRTPLTLMLGPLEDSLAQPEGMSAANRERLDLAHRNSLRLLKLVNTLLDFSRIEAGRIQASYEPTDLALFTAELASVFRSAVERAGMKLTIDCPSLSEVVYVDREMWEKIVLNLLSNAFKFTFEGEIAVSLSLVGSSAELTVRDTGTGIPTDEISRLFERFHRVKGAHGRSYEGSGIGLALVQELVKLHGGNVSVQSVLDRGTTFSVSIPLGKNHLPADRIGRARTTASESVRGEAYLEEALRWLPQGEVIGDEVPVMPLISPSAPSALPIQEMEQRPRILLADDNADMREYVQRLLRERYDVVAVANGESAMESAHEQLPDLILSDVMMPRMDGFQLLRAVRADQGLKNVPVILLSARAGEESRVEGLDAGADDYLVKPFSARELQARIRSHLAMARIRREAAVLERRLRDEAELERNRIHELFVQAPAAIGLLSGPEHRWTFANSEYLNISRRNNAEELIGKTIRESLPELRGQPFFELLDTVYRTGVAHVGTEVKAVLHRAATGRDEEAYFNFVYQPLRSVEGSVEGILIHAVEVTNQVLARREVEERAEALRYSEEQLRKLSETLDAEVRSRTRELEERNADVLRQSGELRLLSSRLLQTQDEERRRIARDLHDSAGQTLTILGINLAQLVQRAGRKSPELAADAEKTQELVQQLHREIRTASYLLHPPLLDENGLNSALSWYIQGLSERSNIDIRLDIPDEFGRLPRDMELVAFRLVQESLTNIHRHSGSETAVIRIAREKDRITLEIRDQGKGISPAKLAEIQSEGSGVGIRGMRERLRQFDGNMSIESDASGTRIFVTIPFSPAAIPEEVRGNKPSQAIA